MIALYHMPGAICAQKVRVCLAEKGVDWESHVVVGRLRSDEYLRLNPKGYVPTLVHDGAIVTESRVINEYLDDAFPGVALRPRDAHGRAQAALWTKEIDDTLHLNVFTLSLAARLLPHFLSMDRKALDINLPLDPTKRERALDVIEKGVESRYVAVALDRFRRLLEEMEQALARSSWLAGNAYTLADVDYAPYVQRLEDLGLSFLWEDKPSVQRWIDQVRGRPSYAEVVGRWFTPVERQASAANAARMTDVFRSRLNA